MFPIKRYYIINIIISSYYAHLKWILMIFTASACIISIFLLSAHFAGNIGYFINLDSLLIVFLGSGFSALALSWGKFQILKKGAIQIFSFSRKSVKDHDVKNLFSILIVLTITVGFCSTCQGIISGVLSTQNSPILHILSYASFTTIYSVIISVFLSLPVVYRNM